MLVSNAAQLAAAGEDSRAEVRLSARAILSISLMLLAGPAWPQQPGGGLKLTPVKGEGAHNSIRNKSATPPAIAVRDENDQPVKGAEVTFQLPPMGASGAFFGWLRTNTGRTDAEGLVEAAPFTPNDEEGRLNIMVTAKSGAKSGTLVVHQANTRDGSAATVGPKNSHKTLWIVLAVAAAAAIGGGVAATRGEGNDNTTPTTIPVSITPGPVTVGGPR
jgi:hypothetical protein